MCGRFSLQVSQEDLIRHFRLTQSFYARPRYNISPGEVIPVLKRPREIEFLKWGFIPHFKLAMTSSMSFINVRSETILNKPSFKTAFLKRRCLIPADGFYEWKRMQRINQPFYIRKKDFSVFAFAGVWEGETFAILTRESCKDLEEIHARMPVIISSQHYDDWLEETTTVEILNSLFMPISPELLEVYPVSAKMNNAKFDNPTCIYSLHS